MVINKQLHKSFEQIIKIAKSSKRLSMSKKYFINNIDTAFGQTLLSQLVKEPTQEPIHMCTVKDRVDIKPNGIKKILKREKPKLFKKKAIQECQVYVYNINETQISDIEFGIKMMQKPFEENKVFILVSDIMAWSASGPKIKKDQPKKAQGQEGAQGQQGQKKGDKGQQQNGQSQKQGDEYGQQGNDSEQGKAAQKPIEYTYFQDGDYQMRVPMKDYEYIKSIQDKVLSMRRDNVKVFIICPGLIYGCGEDTFYQIFKSAWLQKPKRLPYLLQGNNRVPTIHIQDLARFVIKVAQAPPESPPYLLALDQTQDRTQKSLIEAISKGVGSGEVQSVQMSTLIQAADRYLINIDMKPSKVLIGTQEQPVEFEWVAKKGIKENIKTVLTQFCQKQKHRPLKMLMFQRVQEWKNQSQIDMILKMFSEYYAIPVLDIKSMLREAKDHADQDLVEDLMQQWDNINDYLHKSEKKALDETMKVFYRAVRWRLLQNDCANRGFIMFNFPHFKQEIENIFNKVNVRKFKRKVPKKKKQIPIPPKESPAGTQRLIEEGQQGQQAKPIQEQQKAVQQNQEAALGEAKQEQEQPVEQQQGAAKVQPFYPQSIISIKQMGRDPANEVIDFFTGQGIQQFSYDTTEMHKHQIFESIRIYIERNGRPNNYLDAEQETLGKHSEFVKSVNKRNLNNRQKNQQEERRKHKQQQEKRSKLAQQIYENVRGEGQQQIKKMPFRNYLMEFVVPTLNEGLLEVSNIIPNDPVDLLAEYLYQKSFDV